MLSQNVKPNHKKVQAISSPSSLPQNITIHFILLCSILLLTFISIPDHYLEPATLFTATMLCVALKTLGLQASVSGNYVSTVMFQVEIISSCTPIVPIFIFLAFVSAQKYKLLYKINGFLFGALILIAANLLRLVITFIISFHNPNLFHITHIYFGQLMTGGVIVALCLGWMQYHQQISSKDSLFLFLLKVTLIIGILLIPWWHFHKYYLNIINKTAVFFFSLCGYNVGISLRTDEIPYSVFSIIIFLSIMISTKSIKNGLIKIISGFLILSTVQLLMNMCLLGNYIKPQVLWSVGFMIFNISNFVLPIIIWIIYVHDVPLIFNSPNISPICGQKKNRRQAKRSMLDQKR